MKAALPLLLCFVSLLQAQEAKELIVLTPGTAEVMVRGGAFFPEFTRARISGSSLGGSFLKLHTIHEGFRMELAEGGRVVITSPVQDVSLTSGDGRREPIM